MINAQINTTEIDNLLKSLEDSVNDIINEGLKAASEVYLKSVLQSLRKEMGSAADTTGIKTGWNTCKYPLSSGVNIWKNPQNLEYGVNALRDFRLRFFEGGTAQRTTKGRKITGYQKGTKRRLERQGKGSNKGRITANHFFTKGINKGENDAMRLLQEAIITAIKNKGIDIKE